MQESIARRSVASNCDWTHSIERVGWAVVSVGECGAAEGDTGADSGTSVTVLLCIATGEGERAEGERWEMVLVSCIYGT